MQFGTMDSAYLVATTVLCKQSLSSRACSSSSSTSERLETQFLCWNVNLYPVGDPFSPRLSPPHWTCQFSLPPSLLPSQDLSGCLWAHSALSALRVSFSSFSFVNFHVFNQRENRANTEYVFYLELLQRTGPRVKAEVCGNGTWASPEEVHRFPKEQNCQNRQWET